MALLGSTDDDYTKTGKSMLSRWSSRMSFIPGLRNFDLKNIPIVGGTITAVMGYTGTLVETFQWLFRGQVGSAMTAATAGIVSTSVNAISDTLFWWINAASGVATGSSLGTHARAATEWAIGSVGGALGFKPQVLQAYQAGIGYIGENNMASSQRGPGPFASQISAERGQNANEAYARYMSGAGGAYVNELQSAHGRA